MEFIIGLVAIGLFAYYLFQRNRQVSNSNLVSKRKVEPTPIISMFDLSKYTSIQRDPVCPNCLTQLDSFPQRKRKCKSCKKDIIRVKIPDTKEVLLLNEDEGNELRLLIDKYYDDQTMITDLSSYAFETSEENVLKLRDEFFKKYNTNSNDEFFWSYTNKKHYEQTRKQNFGYAKVISLFMLNKYIDKLQEKYNDDETQELNYIPAHTYATNMVNLTILESKKLLNDNFHLVFYTKEVNGCSKQDLDSKKFSSEELIKDTPIPCKNCTADLYNLYGCAKFINVFPN